MDDDGRSWLDLIPKLPKWILSAITFIAALVGFIKLLQGEDLGLAAKVLLITVGAAGFLGSAYLAFKPTPLGGPPIGSVRVKVRRITGLVGLFLIPLLAIGAFAYYLHQKNQPPDRFVILVFSLEQPGLKSSLTREIIGRLEREAKIFHNFDVQFLDHAISTDSPAEGRKEAREEAKRRKARLVIWGATYSQLGSKLPFNINVEVLQRPSLLPEFGSEVKGQPREADISDLMSLTLVSNEVTYLSLFVVGVTHYSMNEWSSAISYFDGALRATNQGQPIEALDQSIVYSYRGSAFLWQDNYDRAIADFNQALQQALRYTANPQPGRSSSQARLVPAYAYVNRGIAHTHKGTYDQALVDLDQALRLNSNLPQAYNARGNVFYKKGLYDAAITNYTEAIEREPKLAATYVNLGLTFKEKGDDGQAIKNYNRAIQLALDQTSRESLSLGDANVAAAYAAYDNRGSIYSEQGRHNQAIENFNRAIEIAPKVATAYYNRGNTYQAKRDYDHAVSDYSRALKRNPKLIPAYINRGNIYQEKGESDRAIKDYKRALQLNPDFVEAHGQLGNIYQTKGQYGRAINEYDRAITSLERYLQLNPSLDPKIVIALTRRLASVYTTRGNAYAAKRDLDQGLEDQNRALQLDPTLAKAYINRGHVYYLKGEYENVIQDSNQAIAYLQQALKLNPQLKATLTSLLVVAYTNRGTAYQEKGDYDRAFKNYNQALSLDSKYPNAYMGRGNVYRLRDDYRRAIKDYDRAIQLRRNFAEAYFYRGIVHMKNGDHKSALADLKMFLKFGKDLQMRGQAKQLIDDLQLSSKLR